MNLSFDLGIADPAGTKSDEFSGTTDDNLERGEHYQDAEIFDLRVPDVRIIALSATIPPNPGKRPMVGKGFYRVERN